MLGVHDGRLAACPAKPNCVSSQATGRGSVAPLTFTGSANLAMARLKHILSSSPRTRIVEESDDYLRAEVSSRVFGFVDDIEFYVDEPSALVHVRSASRVGYSDFGVNRARVEKIRARFRML